MHYFVSENLPPAYRYDETIFGYYVLTYKGVWITNSFSLEDIVLAAFKHHADSKGK